MSISPKNPNQLSVERENVSDDSVSVVRSERLTPASPDTVVVGIIVGVVCSISSMRMSEMRSMSPPSPVITHFHIPLRNTPGSRSHRTSPMAGKR